MNPLDPLNSLWFLDDSSSSSSSSSDDPFKPGSVMGALMDYMLSSDVCDTASSSRSLKRDNRETAQVCRGDDSELLSDCKKCCDEDSDDATSKIIYAGAVLEVCMRKLVFYPEVVNFIEDEKEKFPSVKVQYSFNAPPKLIMLDDAGQHKEIIRIDNWKREHIIEFLREKLKPTSAV